MRLLTREEFPSAIHLGCGPHFSKCFSCKLSHIGNRFQLNIPITTSIKFVNELNPIGIPNSYTVHIKIVDINLSCWCIQFSFSSPMLERTIFETYQLTTIAENLALISQQTTHRGFKSIWGKL